MTNNIGKESNEDLVELAGSQVNGTSARAEVQEKAKAELTRRLIISNKDLNKATKFSGWVMIILTFVLVVLTAILIWQGFK